MSRNDLFWDWWNRDWWEDPTPPVSCVDAKPIFDAGVAASGLPAVVAMWQRVRSDVNTPASREMDDLLRKVS